MDQTRTANSPAPRSVLASEREYAFQLTGKFEGGSYSALQTKDSGIVSYGRHQATLASGSLAKILDSYEKDSRSSVARELRGFLPRVRLRDESLREDRRFLELLSLAGKEGLMQNAQDQVFISNYWEPANKIAEGLGIDSAIGKAIFFDTKVQGGLRNIASRLKKWVTEQRIPVTEIEKLEKFLDLRKDYLEDIAKKREGLGDKITATYLRNSIKSRIAALRAELKP